MALKRKWDKANIYRLHEPVCDFVHRKDSQRVFIHKCG